jgi:hypothetical protein
MLTKVIAVITLAAFVLLSALLQSTTPSTIHPVGILVVLILFYLLAMGLLTFFMFGVSRLLSKILSASKNTQAMTMKQAYYYGSVLALAPVLLVGMRSIGRGSTWDVILVMVFEIIACFYISKR